MGKRTQFRNRTVQGDSSQSVVDTWVANDALVKRFGYFVLEHDDMLIERLENEGHNVEM